MALGRHVHPNEEPEPVAPEADQQGACDPELGQNGGRRRGGAEHHDDGGHDVEQEAVHRQQVGDPAAAQAEFSGGQDLHQSGLDRERQYSAAADSLRALVP